VRAVGVHGAHDQLELAVGDGLQVFGARQRSVHYGKTLPSNVFNSEIRPRIQCILYVTRLCFTVVS
jgi:hypothetical protein